MKSIILLATIISGYATMYNYGSTTASGLPVREGYAACPREYLFGTQIVLLGRKYTCQDRTARWVQKRWPNTFDIYSTKPTKELLKFGRQKVKVKIL